MVEIKEGMTFYYGGMFTVKGVITMSDTVEKMVSVNEDWSIYSLSTFEEIMSKQEYYKSRYESNQAYKKKQDEKIKANELKEKMELEKYNDLYGWEKTFSTRRNIDKAKKQRTTDALNKLIRWNGKVVTKKEMALKVHQENGEIISINKKEVRFKSNDKRFDCVIVDFDLKCQIDLLLFLRG